MAPHLASDDELKTIAELVKASRITLLTTKSGHGDLHSRPLATQEVEFTGELWYLTQDPSEKVGDILVNPQVNAAFESRKGYLSIAGNAEIVHDRQKVDEYWSPAVEAWFPDGREDPAIALIKVRPVSAEFWARDTPGVVTVFTIAKTAFTGGQPEIGDNRTVDL
ncbi:MAG: pyridoxamine 5'-phosphate oxidase family protein [Homoserinimonas sp.]